VNVRGWFQPVRALSLQVLLLTWALLVCSLHQRARNTVIKNFLVMSVSYLQSAFFHRLPPSHSHSPGTSAHRAFCQENACSLSLQSQKACSANKECRRHGCLLIFFTRRAGASICWLPIAADIPISSSNKARQFIATLLLARTLKSLIFA